MKNGQLAKWDMPTRLLHGAIATSLLALLSLALIGEGLEEWLGKKGETYVFLIHFYVGLFAVALVALRLVWGFFGNASVNWRGLPGGIARYPGHLKAELAFRRTGVSGPDRKKGGHNALAIPVYLAALLFFVIQAVTGLALWPHLEEEAKKHLAFESPSFTNTAYADGYDDDDDDDHGGHNKGGKEEEWLEELHEFGLIWLPLFLALHLGGLVMHYRREDKNVFRDMVRPPRSG